MLKLPLTRIKNSNGTEFVNQWTCRTEAGDHIFISYRDGKLVLEIGTPSVVRHLFQYPKNQLPDQECDLINRGNDVHGWKPFCFFVFNDKPDFITTAFVKLHLMQEGLLEIVQWKFLLYTIIFPIVNLIELRKIKHERSLFD